MSALPDVLHRYVEATNSRDVDAMAAAFTEDAVVRDEGRTYRGRAEIRAWKAEVTRKYAVRSEIVEATVQDGALMVAMRVSGDFKGSPAILHYRFGIAGDRIATLEIG